MRNARTLVAAAAVLAVAATGALAQAGGAGRGQARQARQNAISIATVPVAVIDSICTLTTEQKDKITKIQDKLRADLAALPRPQQGVPADPTVAQKRRDLNRQAAQEINAVLEPGQREKLTKAAVELGALQRAGVPVGVVPELKLTADQKTKIAEIIKASREAQRNLTPEERRAKARETQQDLKTKLEAVLTAEQKATVEKWIKEHPRGRRRQNP